jgi:ATP-dependent DNA helicase DinG
VRWIEHGQQSVRLFRAPLSVARVFSGFRRPEQSWVLTSATLSVKGNFTHFQRQLGLSEAETRSWASPFDYPAQGLLYVPKSLPWPSDPGFTDAFVQALLPLVDACAGGVLVLCTTLRAVERVADQLLRGMLHSDRRVMRQGEATRGVLLERFRAAGNAVLVGSTSFWEGIDVPGDALTLVAIDKLPFAPPDDPVLEARLNACRAEGGNPFMEYQLPQAALLLKQGAGRLIRSEQDWGVLMVGDGRLVDKPYGRLLWQGLPPFARTREAHDAVAFLSSPPRDAAHPDGSPSAPALRAS